MSSFINIRKLKEIAQKKINGLTNQSDINEFEDLIRFVQLSGGGHLSVDSDGTLPDTAMIAFDKQYDRFFYNKKAPKFRDDASRPGGTVSDNAVTRTFDRRRRRRTNWSRKIYGRINPTSSSGASGNPSAGSVFGYAMGGAPWPTGGNVIERFSFTSDGNSSDVGDLTHAHYAGGVGQTSTHAYYMGGTEELAPVYYTNRIQKIQFASSGDATELSYYLTGQRTRFQNGVHTTPTHAFLAGGYRSPGGLYSEIQKYSYSDDANASDTGGDLTAADADFGGQMSETHGYLTGGTPSVNNPLLGIRKYPFAITSGSEASVGDLTPQYTTQHDQSGASSATHGYVFSGTIINAIEKFPFAADANSTDVGNLAQMAWRAGATQSTTHGYNLGGSSPAVSVNNIQKFDFSSDGDGTDVGDLTVARTYARGAAE